MTKNIENKFEAVLFQISNFSQKDKKRCGLNEPLSCSLIKLGPSAFLKRGICQYVHIFIKNLESYVKETNIALHTQKKLTIHYFSKEGKEMPGFLDTRKHFTGNDSDSFFSI